jgi:hypothetical protein
MFALGSQEIHELGEAVVFFAQRNSLPNLARKKTVSSLFQDLYGIEEYVDLDVNEKATVKADLNEPISAEFKGRAKTVLDAGTLEHVFDIAQAFANVHELTSVGGTIIHISPVTWYDHAFFNFNPKVFRALADHNTYRLVAEAYHCSGWFSHGADEPPKLMVTFDGVHHPEASAMVANQLLGRLTANVLYMIAYQKVQEQAFRLPYEIGL